MLGHLYYQNMFDPGDFITDGHWNYMVCDNHEEDGERVCKVVECRNDDKASQYKTIPERSWHKYWRLIKPPKGHMPFRCGQVLIKKRGTKYPAYIRKIETGTLPEYNTYTLVILTYDGGYHSTIELYQGQLIEDFQVYDLSWVLQHGSPHEKARIFLKSEIADLEKTLAEYKIQLEQLHYVEVNDEDDRPDQTEE